MLQLPKQLCTIHPIFHVSQLEPSVLNTILNCTQLPPPPIKVDDDLEYEIAKILNMKLITGIGVSSFTMSIGQVTKALTKKTLGYQPLS
jgi:hypothetical protein